MFTETITRQENMTQQDRLFDNAVLNSVRVLQSQVIISHKKRNNAALFTNLMMNNFPVPAKKIVAKPVDAASTTCSGSVDEHFDWENDSVMNFGAKRSFATCSSESYPLKKSSSAENVTVRLNCAGPKSAQLLFCMNLFQMQMKSKWSFAMEQEFLKLSQIMLDFFSSNAEQLKNQHAESIAASICLLVGSKIGISKKDFLDSMKPMKKNMLTKVDKIKKSTCYIQMKKAFKNIIAN